MVEGAYGFDPDFSDVQGALTGLMSAMVVLVYLFYSAQTMFLFFWMGQLRRRDIFLIFEVV